MATTRDIAAALARYAVAAQEGGPALKRSLVDLAAELFAPQKMIGRLTGGAYGEADPETERLKGEAASVMPEVSEPAQQELLKGQLIGAFAPGHLGAGLIKGAGSRTFPHDAAVEANRMIRQGVPDQTVHAITGLWRSPGDLKLRQEINDFNAALTSEGEQALAQTLGTGQESPYAPLHRYMEHPEAFDAYPSLAQVNTRFIPQAGSRLTRFANPGQEIHQQVEFNVGAVPWKSQGGQPLHYTDNAKLSLLHEMTHAIQQVEGMQGGGSPEAIVDPGWIVRAARLIEAAKQANIDPDILRAYEEAFSHAQKRLYAGDREQGYLRIPGEVEARMVERRAGMTHHQRQPSFPLNSYDVPAREVLWDWPIARPMSLW